MKNKVSRRKLLTGSVILAASQVATKAVAEDTKAKTNSGTPNAPVNGDDFVYEVNYTEAEWRARLTEKEFGILRMGGTEEPKSSPLWIEESKGVYHCKGCELPVYESQYKVIVDKGWAFFQHSIPDTVLTGIDFGLEPIIESHCRRCSSHLGHVVYVETQILSCINGAALNFKPSV